MSYLISRWGVCFRSQRQYLLNSSLSGVVRLFLVVEYRETPGIPEFRQVVHSR